MRTVFPNRITSSYYGAGDNDSWSGRTLASLVGCAQSRNCMATYRTTSGRPPSTCSATGGEDRRYSSSKLERHLMVASTSIKLDKLLILWLGSNAIYEIVMRIIALVIGNAAPMPGKNPIRPSANRTRSCTDDCDDDGDNHGNGVGRQEDLR